MREQSIHASQCPELESPSPLTLDLRATNAKQLKALLRSTSVGLRDPIRDHLWRELAARHSLGSRLDTQFDADFDLCLQTKKLPHFVEPRVARFFALNESGRRDVTTVLWHLSQSCPHVTFAPLVYPLTALLLHFHSAVDTYKAMYSLLNARDLHFMATNKCDKSRDAIILVKLTNKFGILRPRKFGQEVREKLKNNNALDSAFAEYLQWILSLPLHHCVRIFDCFLVEGEKFLFRIALTLALLFDKHHKNQKSISLERMRAFCESIHTTTGLQPSQLIAHALKITRLSHKDISRAKTKADQKSSSVRTDSVEESPTHVSKHDVISTKEYILGARIAPRRFKSSVVNWNDLDQLWEWIPERVVVREPIVVFCSEENGHSLQTFFTLCSDSEPTILLIKTIDQKIFGAFCSTRWSKRLDLAQTKSGQYFGTGETFLFSLAPKAVKYDWVGKSRDSTQISHSQQLFLSANARSLCIGSGGGRFGLFVDESLSRGESDVCETFNNRPLYSDSTTHFSIAVLEYRNSPMAVQCVIDVNGSSAPLMALSDDWPQSGGVEGGGGVGLVNVGNTCFMNAIIQCLFHNKSFVTRLLEHHVMGGADEEVTANGDTKDDSIAHHFLTLLRQYRRQKSGSLAAEGVREAMARRHVIYGKRTQHDAQEFLVLLLDALHEHMADAHTPRSGSGAHVTLNAHKRLRVADEEETNDDVVLARREWAKHQQMAGRSPVLDVFQGLLISRLSCDSCQHVSKTFEPFMFLALPLPFVRQKRLQLVFSSADGLFTRLALSVENKYDSVIQVKDKLRELLALEGVANDDLVIAELTNGGQVSRVVDDSEDVMSLNDNHNSELNVFQLNQIQTQSRAPDVAAVLETRACLICLEEKSVSELLSHSPLCSHFCHSCLQATVKHYTSDGALSSFTCPSCSQEVTQEHFSQCQLSTDRQFSIPLLFRRRERNNETKLIYRALMLRLLSRMDASQLYALVDARVPNPGHTYQLVFVERDGIGCCRCSWGQTVCTGCEVSRDGTLTLWESDALCVSYNVIEGFETTAPLVTCPVVEHESIERAMRDQKTTEAEVDVADCLRLFIANECLSLEENQWFCCVCEKPCLENIPNPDITADVTLYYRSVKLEESVRFHRRLDISQFVERNQSQPALYDLQSVVCHFGTVQSGHYTCFVRTNGSQWKHFNDETVTCEEPSDSDARAYILFYTRVSPDQANSGGDKEAVGGKGEAVGGEGETSII